MKLTSSEFENEGMIPARYTCSGPNRSPPLKWSDIPNRTQSLALVVDDPDAPDPQHPKSDWSHWLLYNLAPETTSLPEGARLGDLPGEPRAGTTDFGTRDYRGPCPPVGTHRYFFRLYALDVRLPDLGSASLADIRRAIDGHVLAVAELMGRYRR